MNLTPAQRDAHAATYRKHHTRLYRLHQRACGAHVLVVKTDLGTRIGKLSLAGNVVTAESFDPVVCRHYRDAQHLEACVSATLNAFQHPGVPLADAFALESDPECVTSLPMLIAD
jgi:hypothetical protein